jgi:hypothetical protein
MKIIGFLFCFLTLSTQAQDCTRYKTGIFEVDNEDGTISVITRTKKFQTEDSGDIKVKDKIVWLSDCSYKLVPVKKDKDLGDFGDLILTFTFMKTFDHSYLVEVTGTGCEPIVAEVFEQGFLKKSEE